MDSRTPFVEEVAKTIADRHGKETGSFIFGISGKWGEGKTSFLDELRTKLEADGSTLKVIDVNPWKFSVDRISFLRNFLRVLYEEAGLSGTSALRELDVDTSKSEIDWKRFSLFVFDIAIFCFLFTMEPFSTFFLALSPQWQFFFVVLLVPIFLALVQSVTVTEKTDRATSTLDKFNDLFGDVLKRFKEKDKELVVFVDDLDRVTPEMARDVLDNLRTFFDKKEVTFVVTGDHSVLERYLGRSLLPDGGSPAQLEEGRRFMKKIFNVYWRLPLPIKKELRDFILEEFKKREVNLDGFFSKQSDRDTFVSYLEKYFESNFRQIIRFLDKVIFNFQIIKQKATDTDPKRAEYFTEMLEKPLLVVRSFLIEELCTPLFDQMVREISILQTLEYAAEKKDTAKIAQILEQHKDSLSSAQKAFIEQFIYEEPRFYKESRLQVRNLQPYLSLAADASLGDERGPSGQDFITTLNAGDPKTLKNDLASMGEVSAEQCASALLTQLPSIVDVPQRIGALKTLLVALNDSLPESPIHKIFGTKLAELEYDFVNSAAQPEKSEVLNLFWKWFDMVQDSTVTNKFDTKFIIGDLAQFNLMSLDSASEFKARAAAKWLRDFYPSQKYEVLEAMTNVFPMLRPDQVQEQMDPLKDSLVADLISDTDGLARERRLMILRDHTLAGSKALKDEILRKVGELDTPITQWALGKVSEKNPLWTKLEMEEEVLTKLDSAIDFSVVNQILRFLMANDLSTPEDMWPKILPKHENLITENLPGMIEDPSLQQIAPPQAYASQLIEMVIKKIKTLPESEQIPWLGYLTRGKWPWVNLSKYPMATKFRALKSSKNTDIKQAVEAVEESWQEKKS